MLAFTVTRPMFELLCRWADDPESSLHSEFTESLIKRAGRVAGDVLETGRGYRERARVPRCAGCGSCAPAPTRYSSSTRTRPSRTSVR